MVRQFLKNSSFKKIYVSKVTLKKTTKKTKQKIMMVKTRVPLHRVQRRMISGVNFFVFLRLLFFALLLLLYVT